MRKACLIEWCIAPLLLFLLAGCSGSGESGAPTISGVAAAGSPIFGTVYLKDSSVPAKELSVPIAADGSFSFDLKDLTAPFLLKAVGTSNGSLQVHYSFTNAAGITNINPLSTLAVVLANGSDDLTTLYNSAEAVKMQALINALPTAISTVQTALKPTLSKFGAALVNFISDPYTADHKGIDLFLDMVGIRFGNGKVVVSEIFDRWRTNNAIIEIPLTEFNASSVDIIADPIPAIGSVFVTPNPAVVAPNATLNFSAVVIGSANPQVIWSVVEENGGVITDSGIYTAPATTGLYHVMATNKSDSTKSATVNVEVRSGNILSIVSSGEGVYTVLAGNFEGVAGIEFSLTYDNSVMVNPQVTQGALATGAMFVKNTSLPGVVRWALVTTRLISGSGTLATISFDPLGASPGRIFSVRAYLVDSRGRVVGTTSLISPP